MEIIGSLFLIFALILVVVLFISQPFMRRMPAARMDNASGQLREHERSSLLAERDRVLTALQELDFDFALGKVPEEDYPLQRGALLKSGAEVLRRLDAFQPQHLRIAEGTGSIEERIEAAVAARRADAQSSSAAALLKSPAAGPNGKPAGARQADPLEDVIASRKRERNESSAGFCPHCGRPVQKSDKFCSKCGAVL